ncbi:PREDICTED: pentatricopeptide repeat-containing protein At1g71210-like isoform X1 [Nelumbo nucifera]|uniref:Pentatricopeptide repeat-containing protein At1g71210-like isoform X1 n=2 Tax=Nelumbo nucifera TaxID=4432 RepID=A0A1U8AHM8_NELNU|nr:PREDICTED: pentatricopeptide repeat-containing protein At1g71210-like isoform X1 [Nelumbo nucifera]DAD29097.1 TPA_asm: hypothetical protein HUJ06_030565 [Nelumbo nucifera]
MLIHKCLRFGSFTSEIFNKRIIVCSFSSLNTLFPLTPTPQGPGNLPTRDVALSFKEWFKFGQDPLIRQIFKILSSQDDALASLALSRLGLRLTEPFVLKVLNHGEDVLLCLKFFDWAGRQPGYYHTRASFNAIFKILCKKKLMSFMLDFLDTYTKQRYMHKVRFHDTVIMGYAIAGKPDVALKLFAKMRFQGLDLDSFSYHVLLNALIEENCFDVVEVILKQIRMRGFDSEVTSSMEIKSFCKQNRLQEAWDFLHGLKSNRRKLSEHAVVALVNALCEKNKFEEAGQLMKEFQEFSEVNMDAIYSVWIRDLVKAGKVDGAIEFMQSKRLLEGYVPGVFRYNFLICKLLMQNRLQDVFDLLMEMQERKLFPDKVTMNAALCFFCKAGMVDVALEFYKSRSEFGLSLNSMAYNYLINTLCGDGSFEEAYQVLKNSIDHGYCPGRKTFSVLADALSREGKLDKLEEVVNASLKWNIMLSDAVYDKYITALCKARRVEDAYLIHGDLNRPNKVSYREKTYINMIRGFVKSTRGDMASRVLIEMQENGHTPKRNLYRAVIRCLLDMDNSEIQFMKLLEVQLSRHEPDCRDYNFFIDGAGHAKKPELARKVFETMTRNGLVPNLSSYILLLQSYLKSERISDALSFFRDLCKTRKMERKLYNTMIVGLCKARKPDLALEFVRDMKDKGLVPSLECYEELVKSFCSNKDYDSVAKIICDLEKVGRYPSSFIINVLLFHSLNSRELFDAWSRSGNLYGEESSYGRLTLGELVGIFSAQIRGNQHIENLDEMIQQFFPLDVFTYNMLLRKLCMSETMDFAEKLFDRMCNRGYKPNRWTYDILAHGFFKHGRIMEGREWVYKMIHEGFSPTESTKQFM